MTRIFLPPDQLTSQDIVITGDNARHLSLVLKIHAGESIVIFDGQGFKYDCTVEEVHKKEVIVRLNKKEPYSIESPLSITLAQGLSKGDKMDLIVQKATELGVNKIIPLVTERSQVRHTHKTARWGKIARSASQQSGRDMIPEVREPVSLDDFLAEHVTRSAGSYREERKGVKIDSGAGIIFSEKNSAKSLTETLSNIKDTGKVILLIGPEGGFTVEEITAAVERGFIEASLGPRILRTETAPLAAVSIIQYTLGDMG